MQELLTIDVSHGTTHDGPGMRTTVFLKGCSLRCRWCQNPESISAQNEVWWDGKNCIGCLLCREACPTGAISAGKEGIAVDRTLCRRCLSCAEACPAGAMTPAGEGYTVERLLKEVLKDEAFYREFGGGVTCSGGEPLLQSHAVAAFFRELKNRGISTALDTCGAVPQNRFEEVLPYTDYVLYDIKLFDPAVHGELTGQDNRQILANLRYIAHFMRSAGRKTALWIRTPLIPGATATEENLREIGRLLYEEVYDVLGRWELCAFNSAAKAKYEKLGREWVYRDEKLMQKPLIEALRRAALTFFPEEKLLISGMMRD